MRVYEKGDIVLIKVYNKKTWVIIGKPNGLRYESVVKVNKYTEIITISLVDETMIIYSGKAWFNFVKKNFKELFTKIGNGIRFNRTKRNLYMKVLKK